MLAAKLEYLQHKLIEMDFTMKENQKTIDQKLSHQDTLLNGLLWTIDQKQSMVNGAIKQLLETIGHNLTALQNSSNTILSQQTACANHEQMRKDIQLIAPKENQTQFGISPEKRPIRSCKEEPSKQSGKYLIQPTENDEPFLGYCEQNSSGGGWLVFQYRYDGSLDFNRNWTEYKNGFGSVDGEFWLGLDRLHQLTSARSYELLVELKDFSGNYAYARYTVFEIESEQEKYSLKKLGSYTGTAGDSLTYHKDMKFSTKDQDNDFSERESCAAMFEGAW
uniref:Fibrinogen C-terminal domain-containing protein n=1 Tax=Anopheles christyi TaxID=43041 RepID=A0A182KH16_9DIPT